MCALWAPRPGPPSRHRLSLLERVSAEAVTSSLRQATRERMEDRCRGEYERSFLREFHKVRRLGLCPRRLGWRFLGLRRGWSGVPVAAQWVTNPTRNCEVAGSIPGLTQWVRDLALS